MRANSREFLVGYVAKVAAVHGTPNDEMADSLGSVLARLGAVSQRDGAAEGAAEAFRAALQKNPKNVQALICLAQLYTGQLKDS